MNKNESNDDMLKVMKKLLAQSKKMNKYMREVSSELYFIHRELSDLRREIESKRDTDSPRR